MISVHMWDAFGSRSRIAGESKAQTYAIKSRPKTMMVWSSRAELLVLTILFGWPFERGLCRATHKCLGEFCMQNGRRAAKSLRRRLPKPRPDYTETTTLLDPSNCERTQVAQ